VNMDLIESLYASSRAEPRQFWLHPKTLTEVAKRFGQDDPEKVRPRLTGTLGTVFGVPVWTDCRLTVGSISQEPGSGPHLCLQPDAACSARQIEERA
jgi:hypothetical protein